MTDICRYVINLADRTDRTQEMQRQLARIGWHAEFSNSARPDKAKGQRGFPTIGAYGCFMSHLITLRNGRDRKGHVLIMEDDLNFAPEFNSDVWDRVMRQLSAHDWSIFYPAHDAITQPQGLSELAANRAPRGSLFMLIHEKAVPALVEGLERALAEPSCDPVDTVYATLRAQNPNLRTFVHEPPLGYQRPSKSDVTEIRWLDRGGIIARLVRKWRMMNSDFQYK